MRLDQLPRSDNVEDRRSEDRGAGFRIPGGRGGLGIGTIIVLGKTTGRVGYLNKRGSLVLAKRPELSPTYVDCGPQLLTFAKVFGRGLKADSAGASALLSGGKLQRYGGDTSVFGKGEILTPA